MPPTYSLTSRVLHWLIAALMMLTLVLGIVGEDLTGDTRRTLYMLHGSLGMTLAILALARLINRLREGFAPPAGVQAPILDRIASAVHWVLLLLPFGMLVTGMMLFFASGQGITLFGLPVVAGTGVVNEARREFLLSLHGAGEMIFIAAFVLHVAGALKHHFLDRDDTLRRMTGKA